MQDNTIVVLETLVKEDLDQTYHSSLCASIRSEPERTICKNGSIAKKKQSQGMYENSKHKTSVRITNQIGEDDDDKHVSLIISMFKRSCSDVPALSLFSSKWIGNLGHWVGKLLYGLKTFTVSDFSIQGGQADRKCLQWG